MSKFNIAFLVSVIALGLVACGSEPVKVAAPAECNKFAGAPGWVCDEPVEGVAVAAVGVAEKSAAGEAFMKQMAATDARVQLAQQMQIQVQNMVKQFIQTTGAGSQESVDKAMTSVSKQITNETLVGSKVYKSTSSPDGKLYVLVGIDETNKANIVKTAVKNSMNNDNALWQQFQAGKAQDELAAEIAKQQ
ncbi:MAG: LPP20 family lipoprotein [Gallionellaceae bacterium]|jgi:hypothetical protein